MSAPSRAAAERIAPRGGAVGDEPRIMTLLLADVEGSTARWDADAPRMRSAIDALHRSVDGIVAAHHGERPLEQGEGDSFVAMFASASAGLTAAVELQEAAVGDGALGGLRVRIGLHTGEPERLPDGRIVGSVLNRCARLRDLGHGGQILLSAATRELVVDGLPTGLDLVARGRHRLRGLARPEDVWELRHPSLTADFPPLRSVGERPGNLPAELDRFVGREHELTDVTGLLTRERLVTLTGAGGCGKTRLGIRVAAAAQDRFEGGVWFVDLARLSDADLVDGFVAGAVGATSKPGEAPAGALAATLGRSRVLLVLDNCEHLLDACAVLAGALLRSCAELVVLATSREPLGVAGEVAWRVPSLGRDDAVELFGERAAGARPGFDFDVRNSTTIESICERLDGIPLAIELAAARVRVMSPEAIAAGLEDRFRLLVGGHRSAIPRQRTLAASVEWSHSLLADAERLLFRRLSGFVGGFTLDAAEAVCFGAGVDRYEVLDLLTRLVDRSLVVHDSDTHGGTRYRMLETIRQYGEERLVESGEATDTRDRHLAHYLAIVEDAEPELRAGPGPLLDRIEVELDNLLVAFDWAAVGPEPVLAIRLLAAISTAWLWRLRIDAPVRLAARALEITPAADPHLRGKALANLGLALWLAGHVDRAREVSTEALELSRSLGDTDWGWTARHALGLALSSQGDLLGARTAFLEVVQGRGRGQLEFASAEALGMLAMITWMEGDTAGARALGDEAVIVARGIGPSRTLAHCLCYASVAVGRAGDLVAMRSYVAELIDVVHEIDDPWSTALGLTPRFLLELYEGDWSGAETSADAMGEIVEAEHFDVLEGVVLFARAFAAAGRGDISAAADGIGAALAATHRMGETLLDAWGHVMLGELAVVAGDHPGAVVAFDRAHDATVVTGNQHDRALAKRGRAACNRIYGDLDQAAKRLVEVLSSLAALGGWIDVPDTLEALAGVLAEAGEPTDAARLLGAAASARDRIGHVRSGHGEARVAADLEVARAKLDADAFEAAWAEGGVLSLEEAVGYATRGTGTRLRPPAGWHSLTPVELKVAQLVAEGLTNPAIAGRMLISRNTVKTHLSHIFDKLGVSSRSELAAEVTRRSPG